MDLRENELCLLKGKFSCVGVGNVVVVGTAADGKLGVIIQVLALVWIDCVVLGQDT